MKKQAKVKTVKRAAKKTKDTGTDLPDLVQVMTKIAERLESLERKMETVIGQTAHRSGETKTAPQTSHPKPQQSQFSNDSRSHSERPQHQDHGSRRDRPMFDAICAECGCDCQVPFRPTGERPVYCKECFSKRKSGGRPQSQPSFQPAAPAYLSEVSDLAADRPMGKKGKPDKKSKRR